VFINAFGMWSVAVSAITLPVWSAAMFLVNLLSKINKKFDENKAIYDRTGKIWAKIWLTMIGSYPTFTGDLDRLKGQKGACLFVANHASWLDIPILCTVLDPTFKFIAKGSLRKVPCIGQQLAGVSISSADYVSLHRSSGRLTECTTNLTNLHFFYRATIF
jgi:1-acyl-sn-glycerol-3-phosphate acyltransferase